MVGSHLTPPTVCAAMSTHYKMFIENKSLKLLNLMGNNLYIYYDKYKLLDLFLINNEY